MRKHLWTNFFPTGVFVVLIVVLAILMAWPVAKSHGYWTPLRNALHRLRVYPAPRVADYTLSTGNVTSRQEDKPELLPYPVGVLPDPLGAKGERWSYSGQPVSAAEGKAILAAPVPDDGKKGWLIGIGDQGFQNRVQADAFRIGTDRRVKAYAPDDWACRDRDGKVAFTPGVWIMDHDGRHPKHIAPEDYDGAEWLAQKLRQCQASYDPGKVPAPPNPLSDYAVPAGGLLTIVAAGIGSALKKAVSS